MRVAALMPTRDRASIACRAASTFLAAISRLPQVEAVTLVIADDSSRSSETNLLDQLVAGLAEVSTASINTVRATGRPEVSVARPQGGPGAARNFALAALCDLCPAADVTIMLDDDVSFDNVTYRGLDLHCDGSKLVQHALQACSRTRTIAGCGYVGRQDLSILEHAVLSPGRALEDVIVPSVSREHIENVAPGGISTAFLAIGAPPAALPAFPEHYNEDYVWLHAFERAGWSLVRVIDDLIHAPHGHIKVTPAGLSFQVYGEIVWLAILEASRFPVDDNQAMVAAVEEIAGDIRTALAMPSMSGRIDIKGVLRAVLEHYEAIGSEFSSNELGPEAMRLTSDIRQGLALRPSR